MWKIVVKIQTQKLCLNRAVLDITSAGWRGHGSVRDCLMMAASPGRPLGVLRAAPRALLPESLWTAAVDAATSFTLTEPLRTGQLGCSPPQGPACHQRAPPPLCRQCVRPCLQRGEPFPCPGLRPSSLLLGPTGQEVPFVLLTQGSVWSQHNDPQLDEETVPWLWAPRRVTGTAGRSESERVWGSSEHLKLSVDIKFNYVYSHKYFW